MLLGQLADHHPPKIAQPHLLKMRSRSVGSMSVGIKTRITIMNQRKELVARDGVEGVLEINGSIFMDHGKRF